MTTQQHPNVYKFDDRADWLLWRKHTPRIGASEAAGALGESEWLSPYTLWARKTHAVTDEIEETPKMRAGLMGERTAAEIFCALETMAGRPLMLIDPQNLAQAGPLVAYVSAQYPFMAATPDFFTREPDGTLGLLEIKMPGMMSRHKWSEEPPLDYLIQVYHQFIVCREAHPELKVLRLVAWFGSDDFVEFKIDEPDEDMIAYVVSGEKRLWKHIQDKTPPAVDGSKSSIDTLRALSPAPVAGSTIEIPPHAALRYFEARSQREKLEGVEKEAAASIMQAMGGSEEGLVNGTKFFTWKEKTYNYQAKAAYTNTRREFSAARNWKKVAPQVLGAVVEE